MVRQSEKKYRALCEAMARYNVRPNSRNAYRVSVRRAEYRAVLANVARMSRGF